MKPSMLLLICLMVAGCRDRDESLVKSYLARPALGMINGEAWKVKHVYLNPTIETKNKNDYVFVFLPFKPKSPCPKEKDIHEDAATAMVAAPKSKKKTIKLKKGTGRNIMFQYVRKGSPKNVSAKKGKMKLTRISASKIRGKIVARHGSDNWINGTFVATVCEWNDFKEDAVIGGESF